MRAKPAKFLPCSAYFTHAQPGHTKEFLRSEFVVPNAELFKIVTYLDNDGERTTENCERKSDPTIAAILAVPHQGSRRVSV